MKTNTYQIWRRSKVMDSQTPRQVSVHQSLYAPIGENVVTSQSQHFPVDRAQRGHYRRRACGLWNLSRVKDWIGSKRKKGVAVVEEKPEADLKQAKQHVAGGAD